MKIMIAFTAESRPVGFAAFHLLKKGDSVELDGNEHFEDFATLGQLLARFNERFPKQALSADAIVLLRDAIAHGRVLPVVDRGETVLKLLKFAQPVKGSRTAEVAFAALLTPDWFRAQEAFVREEVEKVRAAARTLSAETSSG